MERVVWQHQDTLVVDTPGRGLIDITDRVQRLVEKHEFARGLAVVFCRHTSCSLVIQENADPSARHDLERWLERLAPEHDPAYTHTAEGPDDMPSHLRAAVTRTSESIPIERGRLCLGTWQGLFLAEHRAAPHRRRLLIHITGTA